MTRPAMTFGELLTHVAGTVIAGDVEGNIRELPIHLEGTGPAESVEVAGGGIALFARPSESSVRRVLDWPGDGS